MTLSPETLAHHWSFGAYLWVLGWLCFLMLGISYFLGARNKGRAGKEPFESGIVSVGNARLRLSAKFYLIAMLFVIFDLESVFLFAWAVAARKLGWPAFWEAVVFSVVLVAALIYLWRVGALDWNKVRRYSA